MAPQTGEGPSIQLERELKWQVDAPTIDRLRELLERRGAALRRLEQENRFFDTPSGRLRRQGMLLRLRRENDSIVMTLKRQLAVQHEGLFQHEETECEVDERCWSCPCEQLDQVLPLPDKVRGQLEGEPLQPLGHFSNLRFAFRLGDDEVALDTTSFPGGVIHHEVEVETDEPEDSRRAWQETFRVLGQSPVEQTESKFSRYRRFAQTASDRP